MKIFPFVLACLMLNFLTADAQRQAKPELIKLPFAFPQQNRTPMENTPVWFDSSLLLVSNYRPGGAFAKGKNAYLYIEDMQSGNEVSRFGTGHSFVSAFVDDEQLNVFALEFSDFGKVMNSKGINRFVSGDLKNWKQSLAISPEGNEHLFNSSVCKDDKGYLMAYESDKPVQFCFKFARSTDLNNWKKLDGIAYTGENAEYSACPVIRYFAPWYYVIYLHAPQPGHKGWISYMSRSKDLLSWELSPFNPILEASKGEGKNNSDVDLLEHDGKTYIYYATGDQETWGTVRVAMYNGIMKNFFEAHFPSGASFKKVSAKK